MLENLKVWAGGVVDKLKHKSAPVAPLHTAPIKAPAAEIEPPIEQSLEIPPVSHASPAPAAVVHEAIPSPQESSQMTSIVTKIATGVVTLWDDIEKDIEADYDKIKGALPASAQADLAASVSDVKQGASDILSMAASAGSSILPTLATEGEKILDSALATYTNGAALPLVPLVNSGVDQIANAAVATINAWALKAKASLAPASAS
jgi:hypothetical protein